MDTGVINQIETSSVGTNVPVPRQEAESSAPKRSSEGDRPKKLAPANQRVSVPIPETSRSVTFEVDRKSNELYIKVVDRDTGEVVRQIPPEALRKMANQLELMTGNILDTIG